MLRALVTFVVEGKFEAVSKGLIGRIERAGAMVVIAALALFGGYSALHLATAHGRPQATATTRQVAALSTLNAALAELSHEKPGRAASSGEFNSYLETNQFWFLLAAIYDELAHTIPAAVLRAAGIPLTQTPLAGAGS